MSADVTCTICGKKFSAAVASARAICADCKAAAISERPMTPDRPAATAIQSGMPKPNQPVQTTRPDGWVKPKTALRGWVYAVILAVVATAAAYVLIVKVCGLGPVMNQPPDTWSAPVPQSDGDGGDHRKS
jgi:hypothetical protein